MATTSTQIEQKPRRTLAEEKYQVMCSLPTMLNVSRGTSVLTEKWPENLRHCTQ